MKKIIKDTDLVLYVTGQLPTDQAKKVKQQAIENGESDMLLNCILANYSAHSKYADELLGVDDFEVEYEKEFCNDLGFQMPMAAKKSDENHDR